MKNFYIVVTVTENGKYYSYIVKTNENNNLISTLAIKNIVSANLYETKKRAKEIVTTWNETYKNNGTYMFDETF